MGLLARIPPPDRRRFLGGDFVPLVELGRQGADETVIDLSDIVAADGVPGTIASLFRSRASNPLMLLRDVAAKSHAAGRFGEHPAHIEIDHAQNTARNLRRPLELLRFEARHEPRRSRIRSPAGLARDLSAVRRFWTRALGLRQGPATERLYEVLERQVGSFEVDDPASLAVDPSTPIWLLAEIEDAPEGPGLVAAALLAGWVLGRPVMVLGQPSLRQGWLETAVAALPPELDLSGGELVRFQERPNGDGLPEALRNEPRPLLLRRRGNEADLRRICRERRGRIVPVRIACDGSGRLRIALEGQ
jgi:hypothetical protein